MKLSMKKKVFPANPRNKQKFLFLIGKELENAGVEVKHSAGDANSINSMNNGRSVAVVGDNTDP